VIERKRFEVLYQQCATEVLERMPDDWSAFASHNPGWRKDRFDAAAYLRMSSVRYWRAYGILAATGAQQVLDVGGFLAAFPLALARLGFEVTIAERYDYYGTSIDAIATHVRANGVRVIDADFSAAVAERASIREGFDAVTCMAVAEHLAHSPRILMENIHASLRPGGSLVFEVPNLAFWPKRYAFFLRGASVLAPISDVYHSEVPFTGHHREYTISEARYVVGEAGLEVIREETFNYGFDTRRIWNRLKYAPAFLFKEWAEVILLHCRKPADRAH
jgi:2-polyprenyl-3-methyl-5-hydroxy-6-metoxy-1,4-benzoquinol methylase